jgi:hypothetical protein
MIISKEYGPQLDGRDGTCGELKLVKRWVLVNPLTGRVWPASQGRHTCTLQAEAESLLSDVRKNNNPDAYPVGLSVRPWWCWPGHHDPACPVEEI